MATERVGLRTTPFFSPPPPSRGVLPLPAAGWPGGVAGQYLQGRGRCEAGHVGSADHSAVQGRVPVRGAQSVPRSIPRGGHCQWSECGVRVHHQTSRHTTAPPPPLQCGVIEVVPDSKSRDQIGKQTQVSLKEYFHSVYGGEDSIPYQEVASAVKTPPPHSSDLPYWSHSH